MRHEFDGAIFEGVLLGGSHTRGSLFGTAFGMGVIPIYDPLNPANIMTLPSELGTADGTPSP